MIQTMPLSRYRWVMLSVMWVTYMVVFMNRLSVGPLAPFLKEELHINSAEIGLIITASIIGYIITMIPAGLLVDRFGAKWLIVIGEFIAGIAVMGIFWAPSYHWVLVMMFLTGLGSGTIVPATAKDLYIWFPVKERATVMGIRQTAINLGTVISAAVLPLIALSYGWRAGFLTFGLVAVGISIIALIFYKETPLPPRVIVKNKDKQGTLSKILHDRNIWFLGASALCLTWVEFAVAAQLVLYLKEDLLLNVVLAGQLLAVTQVAGGVARPINGLLSDRVFGGARKPLWMILGAVSVISCLILALAGRDLGWWLYVVLALVGIGSTSFGGLFFTMLTEIAGPESAGTATGVGVTLSSLGTMFGAAVFGYIVDSTHSYAPAWISLAIMSFLSIVLLLFARETKSKPI